MRAIDDNECRFQGQVLEMQLRCCMSGTAAPPTEASATPEPTAPSTPARSS